MMLQIHRGHVEDDIAASVELIFSGLHLLIWSFIANCLIFHVLSTVTAVAPAAASGDITREWIILYFEYH